MSEANRNSLSPDDIARFGDDPTTLFATNLAIVQAKIAAAAARSGRDVDAVE